MQPVKSDPRIDAYISGCAPFARPILTHLRKLVHENCPNAQETIRWGGPFFECNGQLMCFMAGFKEHCRFGFWAREMRGVARKAGGAPENGAMRALRRITKIEDLPRAMGSYIKQAAVFASSGKQTSPIAARTRKPKPELPLHPEFAAALKDNKKAAANLKAFPPGRRREYVEWISDAKSDETRARRISDAVKWIAHGKSRNWKYESR
jgi:uncharacterized protein YdeI (YjbR/CyaY-like superfamily)